MVTASEVEKGGSEESGAVPAATRRSRKSDLTLRIACHAAAAAAFVAALVADLARGWRPTGDDAIIAQRAWGVFSAHPPLVGQFSQASGSIHAIYDPGPLIFWLLSLPVRVDPVHGVLWGSTLLCLIGVALAVEAAWAFKGATAAGVVVVVIAVVATTQSFVVVNPAWNISIGVVWFITATALTVTVASGRLRWWPVLVGAASIAAQSHLEFAPAAGGLIFVGLGLGLARRPRPRRWWWLAGGLGIGALCWAAPLVDQFTRHPGNLTLLWDRFGHGPTMGTTFGFQALGAAVGPHPLWVARQNRGTNVDAFLGLLGHINGQSELFGVAILASVALVAAAGWLLRRRRIATVASVVLFVAAMAVWVFASLPRTSILTIIYSDIILWPVGMLVWVVWLWAAAGLGTVAFRAARRRLLRPARASVAEPAVDGRVEPGGGQRDDAPVAVPAPSAGRLETAGRLVAALAVVLVGAAGATVAASTVSDPHLGVLGGWSSIDLVPAAAAAVDRARPQGPIAIYAVGFNGDIDYSVAYGVIWQLRYQGRDATGIYPHWQPLGPNAAPSPLEPHIVIHIHPDHTVTASVSRS
jgi:uncharacterized protein (TIGR03382 family)